MDTIQKRFGDIECLDAVATDLGLCKYFCYVGQKTDTKQEDIGKRNASNFALKHFKSKSCAID